MIDFHLLDPAVDPHTVAFVDNDIADGQFLKTADLLPGVSSRPAALLFLHGAENIRFRDHHELLHRIFETMSGISLCDQDLTRLQEPLPVVTVKSVQFFRLQFPGQSLRTRA